MKEKKFTINNFAGKTFLKGLEEGIFTEEFTLKDLDISARVLQYWNEQGLLFEKGRKEDENHKFSFVEVIWLKMILELRKLGYPIKLIKKAKKELFTPKSFQEIHSLKEDKDIIDFFYNIYKGRIKNETEFMEMISDKKTLANIHSFKTSALTIYIQLFISDRQNINFIFFNNGDYFPAILNLNVENQFIHDLNTEPHISIPLFKLILNFLTDERKVNFVSKYQIYNLEELLILEKVRNGKFDNITIHFKNKKPVIIECTRNQKINNETRLNEIFLGGGYERIEVKSQDGDITFSTKTTKYKL